MGRNTAIQWTDSTFNPWIGCEPCGPACAHCYAAAMAKRCGWDFRGERRVTSASNWRQPLKWNREAEESGERRLVFCGSLMDFAEDHPGLDAARERLWSLVAATPHLTWLLLTKRARRLADVRPRDGWPRSVWLGVTVWDQASADANVPPLLAENCALRFVSCEPVLGAVDVRPWLGMRCEDCGAAGVDVAWCRLGSGYGDGHVVADHPCGPMRRDASTPALGWVIAGGESGPHARPMHPAWARSLRDQCEAAGVPFMFKQWGEWAPCALPWEADEEAAAEPSGMPHWMKPDTGARMAMLRVGKAAAGHLLDGREHMERPR